MHISREIEDLLAHEGWQESTAFRVPLVQSARRENGVRKE
jgi:hypothetical protein